MIIYFDIKIHKDIYRKHEKNYTGNNFVGGLSFRISRHLSPSIINYGILNFGRHAHGE